MRVPVSCLAVLLAACTAAPPAVRPPVAPQKSARAPQPSAQPAVSGAAAEPSDPRPPAAPEPSAQPAGSGAAAEPPAPRPTEAPARSPSPPPAPRVETLVAGSLDGPLPYPKALAVAADGRCFVQAGERVVAVDPTGLPAPLVPAGRLVQPQALAIGPGGTLYAVDSTRHQVVAIAPDGSVTPLAGAEAGFADGPGAAARFTLPAALACRGDALYVADATSVRVIALADPAHPVTTLAGAAAAGTADGPLGTSRIADPRALALHGEALYLGDFYKVRKLDLADPAHPVTTVAGAEAGDVDGAGGPTGPARFGRVQGLAFRGDTLYVADREFGKLRAIRLSDPPVVTTALAAGLAEPGGLGADGLGRLYLTSYAGHALLRITW